MATAIGDAAIESAGHGPSVDASSPTTADAYGTPLQTPRTRGLFTALRLVLTGAGIAMIATLSYSMLKRFRDREKEECDDNSVSDAASDDGNESEDGPNPNGPLQQTITTTTTVRTVPEASSTDPHATDSASSDGSDEPSIDRKVDLLLNAFGILQQQVFALGQYVGQQLGPTAKHADLSSPPSSQVAPTTSASPQTSTTQNPQAPGPEPTPVTQTSENAVPSTSPATLELQPTSPSRPKVVATAFVSAQCPHSEKFKSSGMWDQAVEYFAKRTDADTVVMRTVDVDTPEGRQEALAMKLGIVPTIVVSRAEGANVAPTPASTISIHVGLPDSAASVQSVVASGIQISTQAQ